MPHSVYYAVIILTVILLVFSSSGILALLLPYGIDQMEGANEVHISSYIYWFYWFINVGNLFTFGRYFLYFGSKSKDDELDPVWDDYVLLLTSYMATLSIFLALVIFKLSLAYKLLSKVPVIGTPLRNIVSVTVEAFKTRISLRNEINIYERIPFLDYAKKSTRREFSFEEVENVKTFYRILLILVSLSGYYGMYSLINSIYPLQGQEIITTNSKRHVSSALPNLLVGSTDSLTVIIAIPLLSLFRKYVPLYTPKIVYSIELGICLAFASVLLSSIVSILNFKFIAPTYNITSNSTCTHNHAENTYIHLSYLLLLGLIPQCILLSLSEIGAIVGSYEFVYAQSPHYMKGFIFGLLNSVFGICSYIPSWVSEILAAASHCPAVEEVCNSNNTYLPSFSKCSRCATFKPQCFHFRNYDFIFPLTFAVFGFFYAIYFYFIAIKYQRRERQEIDRWYYK